MRHSRRACSANIPACNSLETSDRTYSTSSGSPKEWGAPPANTLPGDLANHVHDCAAVRIAVDSLPRARVPLKPAILPLPTRAICGIVQLL
jgi:hypothetical protein